MKFQLGDTVKDTLSGVEGKVTQYIKHIYSQDRVLIQPEYNKKDMKMPAKHAIDVTGLIKIKDSELETKHQYVDNSKLTLGDTVSYPIYDVKGRVIARALNVNGCYSLEISCNDHNGEPKGMWIEEKGIIVTKKVNETKVIPENRKTGCAMETIESEEY